MLRFIFALYILFMAVYPCSDGSTCLDEQKTGISLSTTTSHDHNSSEQDLCTPFCICSCCAAHVQVKDASGVNSGLTQHNTKLVTAYQERFVFRSNDSIFQPPRS